MKRVLLACLVAVGVLTGAAAIAAPPAHAITLYGLCQQDVSYSICARETDGGFNAWNRDISGDTNQQMARAYQGQVSSTACWPFTCGNGFNAAYNNAAVYKIENIHTGHCMSANSVESSVFANACSASGTLWVWDGNVNTAHLVNVYQTNLHSSSRVLTNNGTGLGLGAQVSFHNWGMVPVIG